MALTQVKTSGIADDAVTLAKQAGGTDGNIISYDASGNPVAIATGSDGQVLTSTGAGSPPAFETLPTSGISDVVSDTSPQLGGDLDTNSFAVALFNAVTAAAGIASKAGGDPAPVEVKTCPSEPVAIATGFPDAS